MRMVAGTRAAAGLILVVLGAALLAVNAWGAFQWHRAPARNWEQFDPSLARQTRDLDDLFERAEAIAAAPLRSLAPDSAMTVLADVTARRFTHRAARYSLADNWIIAAVAALSGRAAQVLHIEEPESILAAGESALCGQASSVLMRLAEAAGIPARLVGLNGHVVVEAYYDGEWHMYDPDMEVVPRDEDHVLGVAQIEADTASVQRYYGRFANADRFLHIFSTTGDNLRISPGQLLSPRQATVKAVLEVAAWVIPLLMIGIGAWILRGGVSEQ